MKKALFLDRDGVINVDHGYVHEVDKCEFIEGIFNLTQLATRLGHLIFIVTNQAGIGRGYYTEAQFNQFMNWMLIQFEKQGVKITKVFYSPFHPKFGKGKYKKNHFSRKPNPGMLLQAINEFKLDASSSVLIGDNVSDIEAGIAAGIGNNLFLGGSDKITRLDKCSYNNIDCLSEAASFLDAPRL